MVAFAEMDLEAAEHIAKTMHRKPINIVCYHCQQSVEKYLKCYLILNGEKAPKTHDLQMLNWLCEKINIKFKDIANQCDDLSQYAVQPRYPAEMFLEERDMYEALQNAKEVKKFISTVLEF